MFRYKIRCLAGRFPAIRQLAGDSFAADAASRCLHDLNPAPASLRRWHRWPCRWQVRRAARRNTLVGPRQRASRHRHHADRNKCRDRLCGRQCAAANLRAPCPKLATRNLVPPRHQRKHRPRRLRLRHNPKLILQPPPAMPLNPRNNLHPKPSPAHNDAQRSALMSAHYKVTADGSNRMDTHCRTSTTIFGTLDSMSFGQHCASNSPQSMCRDPGVLHRSAGLDNSFRSRNWICTPGRGTPYVERAAAHGLLEGDRTASGPGPQRRQAAIFRRGPARGRALCSAKQNSRLPPSSAALRRAKRCRPGPPAVA